MPHVIIDYSANLEDADIAGLCNALRAATAAQPIFPADGVRVRAHRADHWSITDGAPEHGFVDISVRLREGRALADRKAATQAIFEAAKAHLAPVIAARPVMVSLEMRDIDAELAPKLNTVREWLNSNG
jgi:5-carboxymethyl-2-hydroxymuconate isomerase